MKERPILFSAPMVRAILEGRKTQTRRLIKGIPDNAYQLTYYGEYTDGIYKAGKNEAPRKAIENTLGWFISEAGDLWPCNDSDRISCPYGKAGDRLWVREEHYRFGHWEAVPGVKTKTGRMKWKFVADSTELLFDPPAQFRKGRHHKDPATPAWHKRLARFMPRWASRITLEIVSVRVERLNEISEQDAIAEGVQHSLHLQGGRFARENFAHLWWAINGDGSWEANPWVWVIEFKRTQSNVPHS